MEPFFVDAHCHLEQESFDGRLEEVLQRAKGANIQRVVSNQGQGKDANKLLRLREQHAPHLLIALGAGPGDAVLPSFDLESALSVTQKNASKIVAVGEIGLDHYWWKKPEEHSKQQKVFEAFLDLAQELDKPVEVHTRDAEEKVLEIIEARRGLRVVLHHWLRPEFTSRALTREDSWLSVPTLKSGRRFRVLQEAPLERLLCETDSPYAWPKAQNEPANVLEVYKETATARRVPLEQVRDAIFENAQSLFEW